MIANSAHGSVVLDPHDHRVRCASAAPDGRAIAIGSIGRKVSLLDLVTGAIRWQFEGTTELYASVSSGKEERVLEKRREGQDEYIQCMAWSPDGARIAAAGDDRVVRLLDANSGQSTGINLVDQHQGPIRKVCWSPLGQVIVSCSAGLAVIWNLESGEIQSVRAHRGDILGLCFSPCGRKFSTFGEDGVICVWFGSTFKQLATSQAEMSVLSWSPDGKYLVGGGHGGLLCVWSADSGHQVAEITLGGALRFMAWAPGGKYCVASMNDGTTALISAREWTVMETRRTLPSTHRSVGVFFSEDPMILDGELMPELLVKSCEFNTDALQAARSADA